MPYASNAALPAAVRTPCLLPGRVPGAPSSMPPTSSIPTRGESLCDRMGRAASVQGWSKDSSGKWHKVEKVLKFDTERQYVFGWASCGHHEGRPQVEDLQGDLIDVEDLEEAAYEFALDYRSTGVMHRVRRWGR